MERMKHTGDYELDTINMLEQECSDLEEENKRLEEENENLNDYWNITQRTMKDYEDMIDELNDKLNKAKDLFNKRDMTGKDEFLEELRDLLRD